MGIVTLPCSLMSVYRSFMDNFGQGVGIYEQNGSQTQGYRDEDL